MENDNSSNWLDEQILLKINNGREQYSTQCVRIDTYEAWEDELFVNQVLYQGGINGGSPGRANWVTSNNQYQKSKDWRIGFSDDYLTSLEGLDNKLIGKLWKIISKIQKNPITPQGNTVKPLTANLKNLWRYRLGDWRLVYYPNKELNHIIFYYFRHRKEVYT